MIRVLVVDDHPVVRSGLKLLIDSQEDMEAVGDAGCVDEAVGRARELDPDVILLDMVMPERSGLDGLGSLRDACPEARVLVLSMEDNPSYVRDALAGGASGYVLKEAVDVEVVRAIREVAAGSRYLQPELGARLLAAEPPEAPRDEPSVLTSRERETLRLLALGHTNQDIGSQLGISVRTVEGHRANIMRKLGLPNRAAIIRYAISEGLFEPGFQA